jgi:uncharacterized C2H2 Zn-finger protein
MEQFRCPICQTEFSTNEQLDRHMRQHDEQSAHVTRSAPPSGADERRRDEDRESGHRADSRSPADLSCPRCGVEFSTRQELDRHGRAQHPLR